MKNSWYKKGIVFGIVILFIGINISSVVATEINNDSTINTPNNKGRTIYVDDDNTEGPWDGTLEHPYRIIQDGKSVAVDGDTVFVFNGFYCEGNMAIENSIKLIGEDKEHTIIDGSGMWWWRWIFKVTAKFVKISGFTFQNLPNIDAFSAIYICEDSNNISNNIIKNIRGDGIHVQTSMNVISNNIFKDNNIGIYIGTNTHSNRIIRNHIERNEYGIKVYLTSFSFIEKNNFINNEVNAYFLDSFFNRWNGNYWDDWLGIGPYRIKGERWVGYPGELITHYNYDFSPANKPIVITKPVTIPRNRACSNTLLLRLLEQFPLIQRLLKL